MGKKLWILVALIAGLLAGYFAAGLMPPPCWARPPYICPVREEAPTTTQP